MNGVSWLFLYTPFPWLAAMYVAAYRHDLARLTRPFRDNDGLTAWWSVCRYLGLIQADAPRPGRRTWKTPSFLALVAAAAISLLHLAIFVPLA